MALLNREKREARAHAVLMLYQYDVGNFEPEDIKDMYGEETGNLKEEIFSVACALMDETVENLKSVDSLISKYLKKGWRISRLLPVDRAILRVATAELLGNPLSPSPAIINDAVEIAKEYGEDEKSSKLINAILDRISKEKCG